MENSLVLALAESTGFNAAWDLIESAKVNGSYLNNMESHFLSVRNAEVEGRDPEAVAKQLSFDSVEHMLTNVKNQALEDLELRSFDW